MMKNNTGATIHLKSLIFFRPNVIPNPFFRPIVVLDELSIRRIGFRRNVVHPKSKDISNYLDSLVSETTCLERPHLVLPNGGLPRQVLLYSSTCAMIVHTRADKLLLQLLMDSLDTLL